MTPNFDSTENIRLIFDFDGTLTRRDTLSVLGRITNISGERPSAAWDGIVTAYLEDYRLHQQAYVPHSPNRSTLSAESAWLSSLQCIEQRSVERVERAGTFRNVTKDMLSNLASQAVKGGDVELRSGWKDLLCIPGHRQATTLGIISVNWSQVFIREVLRAGAREDTVGQVPYLQENIDTVHIHANEIEGLEEPTGSNGSLRAAGEIRTSADKLRVFSRGLGPPLANQYNVYVGDSITDIECLTAADLGICVRDRDMSTGQSELASCLKRIGISVRPLREAIAHGPEQQVIYWTEHLEEIARLLNAAACDQVQCSSAIDKLDTSS